MFEARSMVLKPLIALILTPLALCAQQVDSALVGHWAGFGDVVVSWTRSRTLAADLTIAANGDVAGSIGDATVKNGHFRKNRGRVASAMGWKTEYIIEGELEGSILREEGLVRATFKMPLNLDDRRRLRGSVATNGPPYGGFAKESFVSKLALMRK